MPEPDNIINLKEQRFFRDHLDWLIQRSELKSDLYQSLGQRNTPPRVILQTLLEVAAVFAIRHEVDADQVLSDIAQIFKDEQVGD